MTPETMAQIHESAFTTERSWTATEFRDLLATPQTYQNVEPHGFALWRSVAAEAELLTIAVDPEHQGKGIGTQLMQTWMLNAAKSADSAFLEVASDNVPAYNLYKTFGFTTVATRPGYYARPTGHTDALVLRAPLPFSIP